DGVFRLSFGLKEELYDVAGLSDGRDGDQGDDDARLGITRPKNECARHRRQRRQDAGGRFQEEGSAEQLGLPIWKEDDVPHEDLVESEIGQDIEDGVQGQRVVYKTRFGWARVSGDGRSEDVITAHS